MKIPDCEDCQAVVDQKEHPVAFCEHCGHWFYDIPWMHDLHAICASVADDIRRFKRNREENGKRE